ncbi:choline/ethanolaminephosphotransferase 1-like [Actinia tenebrosa]|uniref:diacylglycerol cholinephosphotransferase n=1 Tax=Actinia tenebrosa TaxID=6105 RepID=A0A6P8IPX4_ACTTE|nr:choline/ethanolaminephosphotransferase 1-like [Actinia tenebrosa]
MLAVMNDEQLKRLSQHKYSSQCSTVLDPFFQIYWRWLVEQIPLWVAPNLLTVLGLIANVITSFILMYYCPQAKGTAPCWAFLTCAVGLFIYQSLDAIDGKQARRTNSSSPLGELMDHGCDTISMVVLSLAFCISVELGHNPQWMFFICFFAVFLFYCAHWQAYVSGVIKFGRIDVTELQVSAMIIFLLTGIFGSSFWAIKIPLIGVSLKIALLWSSVGGTVYAMCSIFSQIYEGGRGKNGSTIAGTSVLSPLIPIAIMLYMSYYVAHKSPMKVFHNQPCLYFLAFGLAISKLSMKLVVACMSKSPLDFKDSTMLGGIVQILNIHYGSPFDEFLLLYLMLAYVIFDVARYCTAVCKQICDHLNICCFTIPYEPSTKTK